MTPVPSPSLLVFRTTETTSERLQPVNPSEALLEEVKNVNIEVDASRRFQTIHGFGGAFTQASAINFYKLSPARQQEFLRAYFHPTEGNAYTLGRVSVHSCDFSTGNWTYVEENDISLASFSIAPDEKDVLPMIREAVGVAGAPLRLLASPWSPPAWMKTNGRMCEGGALKREHYSTWAAYLVRFLQAYAEAGVPLWAISTQNETEAITPWENCVYTGEEERDFVRDHLGPALQAAGLSETWLYVYDHNRDRLLTHCRPIFDDPATAIFIHGAAYHWYVNDKHDHLRLFHDVWPEKELLFTEACHELVKPAEWTGNYQGFGPGDQAKGLVNPLEGRWAFGEKYARALIEDFNRWNTGYIDWNLLLDETGGPNHVNNFCCAPIMADTRTDTLYYQSSYYYLGHFSRFVNPGAVRLLCTTERDDLHATAFANPDQSIVIVLLNATDQSVTATISVGQQVHQLNLPAHGIVTVVESA